MVKDHSDSERGNPLAPHDLLFPISSKRERERERERERDAGRETEIVENQCEPKFTLIIKQS